MKLSILYEASINRRDFLKSATVAALSVSPIGKLLLAHVGPEVAKNIISGNSIPIVVNAGVHYGRGSIPILGDQFAKVNIATSIANSIGGSPTGFTADEDFYITGQLSSKEFIKILQATESGTNVEINGMTFFPIDTGDTIELECDYGMVHNIIRIYKDGKLPREIPLQPGENMIQAYWDNYGKYGNEQFDHQGLQWISEFNLEIPEWRSDEYNEFIRETYSDRKSDELDGESNKSSDDWFSNDELDNDLSRWESEGGRLLEELLRAIDTLLES